MSDTVAAPTPDLPGIPPTTPTTDETPTTPDSGSNSVFETLKRTASKVFERNGVKFRRGPGRRRKDGTPSAGDIPLDAPASSLPAAAAPVAPLPDQSNLDPALVKRCVSAVLRGFCGFADRILFRRAKEAFPDDAKFCQTLVNDTTITARETDDFADLAEICLRKYGVGTEYAPEIGLAAIAAGVAVRYGAALRSLDAEIERRRVERQKAN